VSSRSAEHRPIPHPRAWPPARPDPGAVALGSCWPRRCRRGRRALLGGRRPGHRGGAGRDPLPGWRGRGPTSRALRGAGARGCGGHQLRSRLQRIFGRRTGHPGLGHRCGGPALDLPGRRRGGLVRLQPAGQLRPGAVRRPGGSGDRLPPTLAAAGAPPPPPPAPSWPCPSPGASGGSTGWRPRVGSTSGAWAPPAPAAPSPCSTW